MMQQRLRQPSPLHWKRTDDYGEAHYTELQIN
jgi:hypothetical protein